MGAHMSSYIQIMNRNIWQVQPFQNFGLEKEKYCASVYLVIICINVLYEYYVITHVVYK